MDLENDFFLVCEKAVINTDGQVSLINILQQLKTSDLPIFIPSLFFIATFLCKDSSRKLPKFISLEFTSPSGDKLLSTKTKLTKLKSSGSPKRLKIFIEVTNVVFKEEGDHLSKISADNKELASLIVSVNIKKKVKSSIKKKSSRK